MVSKQITIVALGGSMRAGSTSLMALKVALEGAREAGASTDLLNIRELGLPMYTPGSDDDAPAPAQRVTDVAYRAAGMVWASPHYHGSVSGSFKNALDWLQVLASRNPPFLTDRVIGLISTAGGVQGLQAINVMEYSVRALRAWAVPLVIPIAQSWQAFDENGRPRDSSVEAQLRMLGSEIARVAALMTTQNVADPGAECAKAAARAAAAQGAEH